MLAQLIMERLPFLISGSVLLLARVMLHSATDLVVSLVAIRRCRTEDLPTVVRALAQFRAAGRRGRSNVQSIVTK